MELRMSAKERDRLKVLSQLAQGQLSRGEASVHLGLSLRQLDRVRARLASEGDAGLLHRLRGRRSNRGIAGEVVSSARERLEGLYKGCGPTLASEKLEEWDGIVASRETVRQWMIAAGTWTARERSAKHRSWRKRRSCFGDLVQMDTSIHDWFGGRGEPCVLLSMIDDATSRVLLRFASSDTTSANMDLLRTWVEWHGRPRGLYVDRAGHFVVTRPATVEEDLTGRAAESQIGRALRELEINLVVAHSPQAKGRVERSFGTCQDRLVQELRMRGIGTIEEANAYLEREFMPMWNARFAVAAASEADAHRSVEGYDLEAILSRQEARVVQRDYTVRHENRRYQIARASVTAGLRGSRVTVEQRLDGSVHLRWRDRYLVFEDRGDARLRPPAARLPQAASASPRRRGTAVKPASDHPWREPYDRKLAARAEGAADPGRENGARDGNVKGPRSAARTAPPPLTPPPRAKRRLPEAGRERNDAPPP